MSQAGNRNVENRCRGTAINHTVTSLSGVGRRGRFSLIIRVVMARPGKGHSVPPRVGLGVTGNLGLVTAEVTPEIHGNRIPTVLGSPARHVRLTAGTWAVEARTRMARPRAPWESWS
jgi:hypothetical protein